MFVDFVDGLWLEFRLVTHSKSAGGKEMDQPAIRGGNPYLEYSPLEAGGFATDEETTVDHGPPDECMDI